MDVFGEIGDYEKRLMAVLDVHGDGLREIPLSLCCSCAMLPFDELNNGLGELYHLSQATDMLTNR